MQRATSNEANARYNDEILFLDGIVEFHPDIYDALSAEDKELLRAYYLVGQPTPENVFVYRNNLVREQPGIEARARAVFARILDALDAGEFAYTTKAAE